MNPELSLILDILFNKTVIIGYAVFLIVLFVIRIITFVPGQESPESDVVIPQSTAVLVNDSDEEDDDIRNKEDEIEEDDEDEE